MLLQYPTDWYVTPSVESGGGRDAKGRALPVTTRDLPACLVAPGAGSDPEDWSAVVDGVATLYHPGSEQLGLQNRDVVVIPDGQWMAGRWLVDGQPAQWPMGTAVRMVKH